jgi:hypothetical protein
MKDEGKREFKSPALPLSRSPAPSSSFILHPSSFILHPSSFILHPFLPLPLEVLAFAKTSTDDYHLGLLSQG